MRSKFKKLAAIVFLFGANSPFETQAASGSFCTNATYSLIYFNGVMTTERQAWFAVEQIKKMYASATNYRQNIQYDLAYNDTTYVDGSLIKVGWNDILETFDQRFSQLPSVIAKRNELFFEAIKGGGEYSSKISSVSPQYADFLKSLSDPIKARYVSALISSNARTLKNYSEHQDIIEKNINSGIPMLLYAHSQGNLFANQAYRYAILRAFANSVKIVHIAPASSELYGDYVLADDDLVINSGLRQVASIPKANSVIPPYSARPAGITSPGGNGKDWMGHGLLEIYLNDKIQPVTTQPFAISQGYIKTAINELVVPCPEGAIEITHNNFSGTVFLDGDYHGWFISTGSDVSETRTRRIGKLKPGKHTYGIQSQSPASVAATLSIKTLGTYKLADGSSSASGLVPAGGTKTFEFTVPPR